MESMVEYPVVEFRMQKSVSSRSVEEELQNYYLAKDLAAAK